MEELRHAILQYLYRVRTYDLTVVGVQLVLIGLVVWWIMRFLRGTRGASLVKGAAVVLTIVYLVIRLLPKGPGWEPIEYLYGKFLLFALAAMVVAFQPELRRGLAQIGRTRIMGGARRYLDEEIETLADAAGYMARNKVGAIIAIERRVGLGAWMETGTPLNADLTVTLLNTIFHPGTQLHDMGVVVQNGRIAAAACQFPLAESEEVDITFGSRHRAALGLAKETDAIILVVSEQTGRISVAMEGQISVGLDGESLRELLRAALATEKESWTQFFHPSKAR